MCDGANIHIGNRNYKVQKGDLFVKLGEVMSFDFTEFFNNRPDNFIHKIHLAGENLNDTLEIMRKIDRHYNTKEDKMSHYFKKETGFTLSQYIINQKITAAKALLKKGKTVTDVALSLGFNSDSYFIGAFKDLFNDYLGIDFNGKMLAAPMDATANGLHY